jgi:hypothetical protein
MAKHSDPLANPADEGTQPPPGFEREPDAAATNYNGPTVPGAVKSVPGAGVVDTSTNAGPNIADPDADHPGKDVERTIRAMPGAERPGTTMSGVSSPPHQRGEGVVDTGDDPLATVEVTGGDDMAPASTPSDVVGPRPRGLNDPDIADPNYTAANKDRQGQT